MSVTVLHILLQENRAKQVRDNKLNKSLSGELNGDVCNGDGTSEDAAKNC